MSAQAARCGKLNDDMPIHFLRGHCCCDCVNANFVRHHAGRMKPYERVCVLDMRGGVVPDKLYIVRRQKHGICEFWDARVKA